MDTTSTAADSIDGGAGDDTFRLFADATNAISLPGTIENIENIYINDSGVLLASEDIDISSLSSVTSLEIDGATTEDQTAANTRTVITVAADQTVTFDSVLDGDAGDDTANEEGEIEIASGAGVTTNTVVFDDVGATGANSDLDIDIAGGDVDTLAVTSQGDTNFVGIINTGSSLETLNIDGDQLFDASEDAVTTLQTIDASDSTGGVRVNVVGSTLDVTFTGGSGDDEINIGGDFEDSDSIDGGAGEDTVITNDATLNSATGTDELAANATSNVEVLATSANADVRVDMSVLDSIDIVGTKTGVSGSDATDPEGAGSAAAEGGISYVFGAGDTLSLGGSVDGGDGVVSGDGDESNGFAAVELLPSTDSGANEVTLRIDAGGAIALTGGSGASGSGGSAANEDGGDGLSAASVEVINIATASADDDVTFVGGVAEDEGTNGDSVSVGANATIDIDGAGDVDLGTVVAAAGTAADDLTIDGSDMSGVLTVATGAGNDTITGGSAVDVITAGTGTNTVTGGDGGDDFNFADDASTQASMTTITDFEVGQSGDVIDFTTANGTFEELTTASETALEGATTLTEALDAVDGQLTAHQATVFTYDGDSYVIYEEETEAGGYAGHAEDYSVIQLAGVTDLSAFDAAQIA